MDDSSVEAVPGIRRKDRTHHSWLANSHDNIDPDRVAVFHKDHKAEQVSTSHPAAAASKFCRCGTTDTTEVPTVLLGVEAASDTRPAETSLVHST